VSRRDVAIVGVADLASPTGAIDRAAEDAELNVARAALADAGLAVTDVDGVLTAGTAAGGLNAPLLLAERLGIRPRFIDGTRLGGASPEVHVEHAAAAIAAGLCEIALISYAETPRSDARRGVGRSLSANLGPEHEEWERPSGVALPIGGYAMAARRHCACFGTTPEQLAAIAVSTRAWAAGNPSARARDPITVDDVLASGLVADPLHRLDCCLVTDGAGAVVMTSTARAAALPCRPVRVLGAASAATHVTASRMPDFTTTAAVDTGRRALAAAGVSPADVDVLETYDSFTITVLLALEDLGFCPKGEGGRFAASGALGPGGALPTNTSGGGLSYTHPGMFGIFLLVEAVRQLRGDAGERQVAGAEVAVAHGVGGVLGSFGTVVLGGAR
jgi:acetyl-CoA acetyltransferase